MPMSSTPTISPGKAGTRTSEALIEAVGRALTAKDARAFFEHRGCRATAQIP